MNIFTSYKEWFINTMEPIIQVSIIKYDISQYRLMRNKIQRYEQKMERLETPEEKQKMMNIIEVSKLQLNAFPTLRSMYDELNKIFKYRPFKEQFNKNSFQLKEQMTNIQKRKFDLLRWIRNSERSLFQLLQMELIKNNNGRSIRQKRNENHSREELKNNWIRLVLNVSSENIRQAYQRKNEQPSLLTKRFTNGLKQNNFNLSLNGKKKHLKTNECKYDFEEKTPLEKRDFLNEIERKKRNNDNFSGRYDWETTLDMLGINQLSFLKINKSNTFQNHIKKENLKDALIELINLYLMPIHENYSDVFLLYRENIMMCISFLLYDNNIKIIKEGEIIGQGFFGNVRKVGNKAYKYEDLKIMTDYERVHGVTPTENNAPGVYYFKKYPINSYESCHILFNYMIQKYLYELNHDYVPKIENIQFDFESSKHLSRTIMNLVKNTGYEFSNNFSQIIFNREYWKSPNILLFIKNILIKLCDILIFYQNKCYFVHRDLHIKNIIINYNKTTENNTIIFDTANFNIKLIDFSVSSIIINNESNIPSQLQYTNLRPFNNCILSNPYLNKEWEKIDLKYFFIVLLFMFIPMDLTVYKENKSINTNKTNENKLGFRNIESFFRKILNIYEPYINYLENLENLIELSKTNKTIKPFGCVLGMSLFDIFLDKQKLKVFGDVFDDNIFNPRTCKEKLKSLIL